MARAAINLASARARFYMQRSSFVPLLLRLLLLHRPKIYWRFRLAVGLTVLPSPTTRLQILRSTCFSIRGLLSAGSRSGPNHAREPIVSRVRNADGLVEYAQVYFYYKWFFFCFFPPHYVRESFFTRALRRLSRPGLNCRVTLFSALGDVSETKTRGANDYYGNFPTACRGAIKRCCQSLTRQTRYYCTYKLKTFGSACQIQLAYY